MGDKLQLYYKFYNLSRQQLEEMKAGNFDEAVRLIHRKNLILQKIADVNVEEEIKKHPDSRHIARELRDLMIRLGELEDKNIEKLQEKSEERKSRV